MKVYQEIELKDFKPWSGAKRIYDIIAEVDGFDTVEMMIEDCFPDGIGETELNDLLWFDSDTILYEWLELDPENYY